MAVESVRNQTLPAREIIVVIDHNPILFARASIHWPTSCVQIIESRGTRGVPGARNTGVATAQAEIIAFLDDDAVAAPDWLEQLSHAYADERVLGVGGAILPDWETERPAWFPEEFNWVVGCTYKGMPKTARPVRNLIGANMSFRRHIFDAIGGFRLGYSYIGGVRQGYTCDETDFCIRTLQRWPGTILLFEPKARVTHRVHANRVSWSFFCSRCESEGESKAMVSHLVGVQSGLSSEWHYVLFVLPSAVLNGLAETARGHGWGGARRACAIVAGLFITWVGFVKGQLTVRAAAKKRGLRLERTRT